MSKFKLTQRKVIGFCLILLVINLVIYLKKIQFADQVRFGSDSGGYQIVAVNFAKGYGLMNVGSVAGDYVEDYKFQPTIEEAYQAQFELFLENGKKGDVFSFYKTPGYPFFLGMIYKIFGVSPLIAKQIQLILVVAVASFLPLIGYYYWKESGFLAGLISISPYLKQYAKSLPHPTGLAYPNQTMAEPLMTIFLLLFVFSYIYWQKNKQFKGALVLGIISGFNILIKASTMLLPILIVGYFAYLVVKKIIHWSNVPGVILGVVLVILPWSIHASRVSGERVILSTQGPAVLLTGHNELALDGSWHKEATFYNQPEIASLSVPRKLMAFYSAHPEFIPRIFLAKINSGFGRYKYLVLALMLINYNLGLQFFKNLLKKLKISPRFNLSFLLALPIIGLGWRYLMKDRFEEIIQLLISLNPLLIGLVGLIVINKLIFKKPVKLDMPVPLVILFLNFLLITLATSGIYRNIQVIDFMFILVFFKQLLDFLKTIYQGVKI